MTNNQLEQDFENSEIMENFTRKIIPAVYRNLRSKDYNNALEILDDFFQQNAAQDQNSILENKCDSWKGLIFEEQGRYQEALLLYEKTHKARERSDILYIYSQIKIARVWDKMGQFEKAIELIKKILKQKIEHGSDLLKLLNLYVDVLEKSNKLFPIENKVFVEAVAHQIGIELSNVDLKDSINLSQEIKELSRKDKEANRRYSLLVIALNPMKDNEQKESLLRSYISQETVGFYRNLAIEQLNEYSVAKCELH